MAPLFGIDRNLIGLKSRGKRIAKKKLLNKDINSNPEMKLTGPVGMESKEPFSTHRMFRDDPTALSETRRQVTCSRSHP